MLNRVCLIVLFVLCSISCFAQTNSDFNYNLGIKAFSFAQTPLSVNDQTNKVNLSTYLSGLVLKFNDNQIAYRIELDGFVKNNFHFNNADTAMASGKYHQYALKLGFEKDLSAARFKPYFGFDIGFIHTDFDGAQTGSPAGPGSSDLHTQKNGLLLAPFIGLKYRFLTRFYVSIESSISFIFTYNRVQNTFAETEAVPVSHFTRGEYLTAPVSIVGLHYNFGAIQ